MKKSATQDSSVENDDLELEVGQENEDFGIDDRDAMIEAVKAAAEDGAFPTVLISIGPPLEGEAGHRIDVAWSQAYDQDAIVDLLLGAVEALSGHRH